jgi:hypothetical protein
VRRIIALFIVSAVVAVLFGVYGSPAIRVQGQSVSNRELNAELTALNTTGALQCFFTALDPINFGAGGGAGTMSSTAASSWASLRVEGMAVNDYMRGMYHPSSTDLANATTALEDQMSAAATKNSMSCPGTTAQAISEMPAAMRHFEILAEANSIKLVSELNATIPLTTASLTAYYDSHKSSYDTLCISVALVAPQNVSIFTAAEKAGASVSDLAKTYSTDSSAASGGSYGCVTPGTSAYASVRSDVAGESLNHFSTTPKYVTVSGSTFALYVAVTKRTTTPFASAESAVLSDVQSLNASTASTVKNMLLYRDAVAIAPSVGRWGLSSSGPAVYAPAKPTISSAVATLLTTAATTPYH